MKRFLFALVAVASLLVADRRPAYGARILAAGDIGDCTTIGDSATAALLDQLSGTVLTLGDNAYAEGTAAQFRDCYHPTWGRHKGRTRPAPGNHDYKTLGADGYFDYFGAAAGPNRRGYYTFQLGAWRIYSLNSELCQIDCAAMIRWLRADLAANPVKCALAFAHRPVFSSGSHGGDDEMRAVYRVLDEGGVEIYLAGHDHNYERFVRMNVDAQFRTRSPRQFVVGTGGTGLRDFGAIQPGSQFRASAHHGVLELTLLAESYHWRFISTSAGVIDRGAGVPCY